ncbi:MAG: carcinine hydrolase/isopenicillin-N N-acyltransferase family protein, partial [Treponema sp.]|nr:carcinine hydrolase/isopenicillin-N N-acyltransferase family protein [Treponema sp.]
MEIKKLIKKIAKIAGISFASIVVVLALVVFAVWHNEISAVSSMKMLRDRNDAHKDGAVYTMHVKGNYYFDKFIEQGGVSNDKELLSFITANITKGLIKMQMKESNIGCSSFTAQTKDGKKLFGRNYDFAKTNTCIVFTDRTKKKHATISTVDLQFLGMDTNKNVEGLVNKITCLAAPYAPLDGINDAGVSCGIYMTYQGEKTVATNQNTSKPDFTSTTMLRMILDYADNVEEAVEIAQSYDLHDSANTSYHYMVADASGKSAILEWVGATDETDNDGSARKLVVTYNDKDSHIGEREGASNFQWITNFIIQPGYYDNVDPSEKKGADRYDNLYEDLSPINAVVKDDAEAMEILSHVGRRNWGKQGDSNSITVHSVVYNLTDKTAMWVPNEL